MFLDVLPDPNYTINEAGIEGDTASPGVAGPGFVSLSMGLIFPTNNQKTIRGYTTTSSKTRPYWDMMIKYNPLTKVEFDPVYNFLLEKIGSKKAFYISLPQYKAPKNSTFAASVLGTTITNKIIASAGSTNLEVESTIWAGDTYGNGLPIAGDIFTISDPANSLHTQAYMISRIDTFILSEVDPTTSSRIRIHFFPGLQRATPVGAEIIFNNPLFRVTQTQDIQEYSLNTENLYTYSLKLEEALY